MASPGVIDQLCVIIVSGSQAVPLMKHLIQNGFYYTIIDSSGGVIQEPMVCLLIGLDSSRLTPLLELVHQNCGPYRQFIPTQMNVQPGYTQPTMIEAQMGGALVYSMCVERFIQI